MTAARNGDVIEFKFQGLLGRRVLMRLLMQWFCANPLQRASAYALCLVDSAWMEGDSDDFSLMTAIPVEQWADCPVVFVTRASDAPWWQRYASAQAELGLVLGVLTEPKAARIWLERRARAMAPWPPPVLRQTPQPAISVRRRGVAVHHL